MAKCVCCGVFVGGNFDCVCILCTNRPDNSSRAKGDEDRSREEDVGAAVHKPDPERDNTEQVKCLSSERKKS